MINEIILASAISLSNGAYLNVNDFYQYPFLTSIFYYNEFSNSPVYFYDMFTNRYAIESGNIVGQTNYPSIEQELDYYGSDNRNLFDMLDQGAFPYTFISSDAYYNLDLNITIDFIQCLENINSDIYLELTLYDDNGIISDYATIGRITPLNLGDNSTLTFYLSDYLYSFEYTASVNNTFNGISNFRYISLCFADRDGNCYNLPAQITFEISNWYLYWNNSEYSEDLINVYLSDQIITNSQKFKAQESDLYNLENQYNDLEERFNDIETLNQELIRENQELKANAITGNTFGSIIKIISDNAAALLEIEILPNFTIGNIIFIPVIFSLLGIIFKFFRR